KKQPPTLKNTIQQLFSSIRLPITAPEFVDVRGAMFKLPGEPHWTKPLRNKVLVLDADTRQPTEHNQIFNETKIDWIKLGDEEYMSASVMNHYLWAQIHGYDYKYYQAAHIPDHYDTWIKVHAIHELLHDYQWVVFLDADAVITHLEVPVEWLFNRWNITEHTSIAMPNDVTHDPCISCDAKGKVMQNTGLIIAHQLPHTFEMFNAWEECTTEKRYENCGRNKHIWAHEQQAFSDFIRYDFNETGNVVEISCFDANGYPEKKTDDNLQTHCNGTFVRHYWHYKEMTKIQLANSVMQSFTSLLQRAIRENISSILVGKAATMEEVMKQKNSTR
ncbi:hypothetical protein K469DRAFT_581504, partial [Zopfia rhizophila CBS 207.26]